MAAIKSSMRPMGCLSSIFRELKNHGPQRRLHTIHSPPNQRIPLPENIPEQFLTQLPRSLRPGQGAKKIEVFPPPQSPADTYKEPITTFTNKQLDILDPSGERRKLFARLNLQGVKVGDILRVTFKTGDPFSGVCLSIRQRGIDTTFLLRNHVNRVGCEMWVKVFSPSVSGVEIVQRTEKRKRRARLTYMRKPKHDMGSVDNIVQNYMRNKRALSGVTTNKKK